MDTRFERQLHFRDSSITRIVSSIALSCYNARERDEIITHARCVEREFVRGNSSLPAKTQEEKSPPVYTEYMHID